MFMKKLLVGAALALTIVSHGYAADPSLDDIVAGAKKEGHLVWYTGSERDPAQAMLDAFQKKYPFVKAEMVRASSAELANRVEAELASNRLQGDVFEYSLIYLTKSLESRGEIMQFDPPEYAAYPKEYSSPGLWAATGLSSILIMVNTQNVDAADTPKSWADLTKPYWQDKLVIDNLEVSGTGYNWLYDTAGENGAGWNLVEAIGKNKPGLERGHAGMAQKVAAGEYSAAIEMADFHIYALLKRSPDAPVRAVWPAEGVPREIWTGGIFKRAPHPNAARLFQTFMLSQEGQAAYTEAMGRISARSDVAAPKYPDMPPDVHYTYRPVDDLLKDRPEYVAKWKQLWGLNSRYLASPELASGMHFAIDF